MEKQHDYLLFNKAGANINIRSPRASRDAGDSGKAFFSMLGSLFLVAAVGKKA
ncbi:hypothetical protein [Symbiopectobacterium sp. RP]|uniref:hypothetical protein n=1 Tax=Symbiopectobacterium sp. RP TaxID=3248553 RepID=UPI003D2BA6FA